MTESTDTKKPLSSELVVCDSRKREDVDNSIGVGVENGNARVEKDSTHREVGQHYSGGNISDELPVQSCTLVEERH